jgi:hypothetical protein
MTAKPRARVTLLALLSLMLPCSCSDNEKPTGWQLTRERMANLASAIVIYEQEHGELPHSLGALREVGAPYFDPSQLTDAWGNPMRYRLVSDNSKDFIICSSGPNGLVEGSGGDDGCYSPSEGLVRADE